jgi:hypothetical protein
MNRKTSLLILIVIFNIATDSRIICTLGEQDSWIRSWGTNDADWCSAMCIDSVDNIYITVMNELGNQFLLKYDTLGTLLWDRHLYNNPNWFVTAIDTDSSNNLYIAGVTNFYTDTQSDIFFQKYNSSGNLQWNFTWGCVNDDWCSKIAFDSSDNLYAVGGTNGVYYQDFDMLLLKFNSSGELLFNHTWGYSLYDSCYSIAIDSLDNLYLSCSSYDPNLHKTNSTLIRSDTSGDFLWNQTWDGGPAICAIDFSNNIIVSDYDDLLSISSYSSSLILKYHNSGALIWNMTFDGKITRCEAIAIDSQNNIYLIDSYIHGCCNWLGMCSTCSNMILGVYNSSGAFKYEQKCYRTDSNGKDIAFDSLGNLYLAGETHTTNLHTKQIVLLKNPKEYIGNDFSFLYVFIPLGIICSILGLILILKILKLKKKRVEE